jgi:hypothetical protein
MEKRLLKLLPYGYGLEVMVLIMAYLESYGDTTAFFQVASRLSGRVSLLFFLIYAIYATLSPSPKNRDSRTVKEGIELTVKTSLSKDFAIIHVIHWMFLAVAVTLSGFELVFIRMIGGALAYLMIILMPLVYEKRLFINRPLQMLENGYIIYVWFIFFMTYVPRILGKVPKATGSMSSYIALFVLTIGFMVWRVVLMQRERRLNIE